MATPFRKKDQKKEFKKKLNKLLGFKAGNLELYCLAFTHSSLVREDSVKESNERLEFLGDAILDAYIAEYLFKKYPFQDEGFLTEIRSRIVKRETLNDIAMKIGMKELLAYNKSIRKRNIFGNAFEALVGAIYLDKGYKKCGRFIQNKVINTQIDIEHIVETNENYKSILFEWASKEKMEVIFQVENETEGKSGTQFKAIIYLKDRIIGQGQGTSKKLAEKHACEIACQSLELV